MTSFLTWEKYHPEVAQAAGNIRPWPCDIVHTDLARVSQPCLVKGPGEELFVAGTQGQVFHSRDGGTSWAQLATATPLNPPVPEPFKLMSLGSEGIGVSRKGTLLIPWELSYNDGRPYCGYRDETYHRTMWVTRSEDRGKTWEASPLFDPSPHDVVGGNRARFLEAADGRLIIAESASRQPRPGRPLAKSEWTSRSLLFCSQDDGGTWTQVGHLGDHSDESDFVELPTGRLLACTRYQRKKLPSDPEKLATPYWLDPEHDRDNCWECRDYGPTGVGGHSVYKQTAVFHSDDGGKSWTHPRIVTGWIQQTGCLVRLSDGTIVLPFGHKDRGHGQRFILSYNEGHTWSKVVFELNKFGMYASTVVLTDGTLVTALDSSGQDNSSALHVLRWKAPPREEVEKHGFFTPRPADLKEE